MLETRMPPVSPRTRRLDDPPRSAARGRAVSGSAALAAAPAPRALPASRPSRRGRSEVRLMGLATTCTAVVCGLLLLYLAAYAHVSQLGYAQAQARLHLRQNQLRNESLRAERDRLQSRQYVLREASALGMTPRGATPITYVTAPSRTVPPPSQGPPVGGGGAGQQAETAADAEQGTYGGTTADGNQQPSLDH